MKGQQFREKAMQIIFMAAALASILSVILICLFLFANGVPALNQIGVFKFLAGREWSPTDTPPSFGILPMILGSLYITAGAICIGVPIGILCAICMARMCPKGLYKIIKPGVDLLAGIPSVVYGFFGMVTIVPLVRDLLPGNGNSILSASILLGLMILPTIIKITESAISAVPNELYDNALALGASHERAVFRVLVPAAKSGVISAIILGIGRAIGETMAVIMVAGNQARMPVSILKGVRTLTANIVIEMGYAADLHRGALIATGVTLFIFIMLINLLFATLRKEAP